MHKVAMQEWMSHYHRWRESGESTTRKNRKKRKLLLVTNSTAAPDKQW